MVIDGGRRAADVAASQHLLVASVYAWVKKARLEVELGAAGGVTVASLQQDNVRLRKELKIAKEQTQGTHMVRQFLIKNLRGSYLTDSQIYSKFEIVTVQALHFRFEFFGFFDDVRPH